MDCPLFEGDQHRRLVRAACRGLSVPRQEREDMEAEGMLILLQAIQDYDASRGVQFSTYAVSRLRGGLQQVIRKERRWHRPHPRLPRYEVDPDRRPEEDEIELILAPDASPEAAVMGRTQQAAIRAALRRLPEPWQHVLRLRYWYERTYAECGREMARSIPTVRSYELKALERMRGLLNGIL